MRRFLAFALLLLPFTALADFDVYWYFKDRTQNVESNRPFYLTALQQFTVNGTNSVVADRIQMRTDAFGYTVASNLIAGTYRGEFQGRFTTTIFTNTFTNGTTGYVNGADYGYISTNTDNTQSAYSKAASDLRFYPNSNPSNFISSASIPVGITNGQTGHTYIPVLNPYAKLNYNYFPMGYDHWVEMGSAMSQIIFSNKLHVITNSGLDKFTPTGRRYMVYIQEWTTNTGVVGGHLPIDFSRWPQGISNAFRLADQRNCDVGLYIQPDDISAASLTQMGTTNYESVATDIASWFNTFGNSRGNGALGIRYDYGSGSGAWTAEQKIESINTFLTSLRSKITNAPVFCFTAGWGATLTNMNVQTAVVEGVCFRTLTDWGGYDWPNGAGNWTNRWGELLYRIDHTFPIIVGNKHWFATEICCNNCGDIESTRRAIVSWWAISGGVPVFTYVDDNTYTTNREVNALFWDELNIPAEPLRYNTNVFLKPLKDGSMLVAFLNRSTNNATGYTNVGFRFTEIGFHAQQNCTIRDLWTQTDRTNTTTAFTSAVPAMTIELFKVTPGYTWENGTNLNFANFAGAESNMVTIRKDNGRVGIGDRNPALPLTIKTVNGFQMRIGNSDLGSFDIGRDTSFGLGGALIFNGNHAGGGAFWFGVLGTPYFLVDSDGKAYSYFDFRSLGQITADGVTILKSTLEARGTAGFGGLATFTNAMALLTNATANWPATPQVGGAADFQNSNGHVYLRTSLPFTKAWAATNHIAP